MAKYRESVGLFEFHNANPKGRVSSGDCAVRAISTATGKDYDEVYKGLFEVGFKVKDMPSSKKVFQQYLSELGFGMYKQPRFRDGSKYTAEEFAMAFNKGSYIISLANHLSAVIDGKIYDTWNCGKKSVGNYWKIK